MSEQVKITFKIPDDCPKDIELMSIWSQAFEEYKGQLNTDQFRSAVNWFREYINSEMNNYEL